MILAEKIESLRRCVQRVEARRPDTVEALRTDADAQDIVTLNLARAVQLCVDMAMHVIASMERPAPQAMGESFDRLADEGVISAALARRMRSAVGFRNVAVHSYQTLDWAIVHSIAHRHLEDFRAFARSLDSYTENP